MNETVYWVNDDLFNLKGKYLERLDIYKRGF